MSRINDTSERLLRAYLPYPRNFSSKVTLSSTIVATWYVINNQPIINWTANIQLSLRFMTVFLNSSSIIIWVATNIFLAVAISYISGSKFNHSSVVKVPLCKV